MPIQLAGGHLALCQRGNFLSKPLAMLTGCPSQSSLQWHLPLASKRHTELSGRIPPLRRPETILQVAERHLRADHVLLQ